MLKLGESDVVGDGPTLEKVPTSPDVVMLLLFVDDDGLIACGRALAVARMAHSTLNRALFIVYRMQLFLRWWKERRIDSLQTVSRTDSSAR